MKNLNSKEMREDIKNVGITPLQQSATFTIGHTTYTWRLVGVSVCASTILLQTVADVDAKHEDMDKYLAQGKTGAVLSKSKAFSGQRRYMYMYDGFSPIYVQ